MTYDWKFLAFWYIVGLGTGGAFVWLLCHRPKVVSRGELLEEASSNFRTACYYARLGREKFDAAVEVVDAQ